MISVNLSTLENFKVRFNRKVINFVINHPVISINIAKSTLGAASAMFIAI